MTSKNPNATAATGTGSIGVLVVWALGHFGVELGAEVAAVIAGAITSLVLLVGRDGVRGLLALVWRGRSS